MATVGNLFNEFQRTVFDEPGARGQVEGATMTATMEDNVTKVQDLVHDVHEILRMRKSSVT